MTSVEQHLNLVEEANKITKRKTIYAAGAGLIPFPILDAATLMAIQLTMIRSIGNLYGIPFKEDLVKPIVASLAGSFGSVGLVKFVPGWGTMIGSTATILSGAAATYALGRVFTNHFDQGGTLLNFDPVASRAYFQKEFSEGRLFLSRQDILPSNKAEQEEEKRLLEENRRLRMAVVDLQVEIEYLGGGAPSGSVAGKNVSKETVSKKTVSDESVVKKKDSAQNVIDFAIIEGIGSRIKNVLKKAGINSMEQLANTKVETLKQILKDAGGKFHLADPETWPQQATLAAAGKIEELRALQEKLLGGRKEK